MDEPKRGISFIDWDASPGRLVVGSQASFRSKSRVFWYSLIVFALVSNGVFVHYAGVKLTPGRILGAFLLVGLLVRSVANTRVQTGGSAGVILFVWLIISLAINLFHPHMATLLKHWINISAGIAWFYIIVNAKPKYAWVEAAVARVGLMLGVAAAFVLVAKLLSFDPFGITTHLISNTDGPRLVLLSWEPNVLGAIIAMILVISLPRLTLGRGVMRLMLLTFVLLLFALLGSLSKGPWLAFAIGMTGYIIITLSRRAMKIALSLAGVTFAAVIVLLATTPVLLIGNVERPQNIVVRLTHIHAAFSDVAKSPLFGDGTFSMSVLWPHINEQFGGTGAWVGQTVIAVIHDTGVVGLSLFLIFWLTLFSRSILAIRRHRQAGGFREITLSYAAIVSAGFVLLAMGLATTLYALPVYWAVMGLVACVPQWVKEAQPQKIWQCA